MKVLVELDLANPTHKTLFDSLLNPEPAKVAPAVIEVSQSDLLKDYQAAMKADPSAAASLLSELKTSYGDSLSLWTNETRWMASMKFAKLADNPADFF